MFENRELLNTFIELCGYGKNKPFECVGTYEEINFAISKTIVNLEKENKELPYLLSYYKEHYGVKEINNELIKQYNEYNNVPREFASILKAKIEEAIC